MTGPTLAPLPKPQKTGLAEILQRMPHRELAMDVLRVADERNYTTSEKISILTAMESFWDKRAFANVFTSQDFPSEFLSQFLDFCRKEATLPIYAIEVMLQEHTFLPEMMPKITAISARLEERFGSLPYSKGKLGTMLLGLLHSQEPENILDFFDYLLSKPELRASTMFFCMDFIVREGEHKIDGMKLMIDISGQNSIFVLSAFEKLYDRGFNHVFDEKFIREFVADMTKISRVSGRRKETVANLYLALAHNHHPEKITSAHIQRLIQISNSIHSKFKEQQFEISVTLKELFLNPNFALSSLDTIVALSAKPKQFRASIAFLSKLAKYPKGASFWGLDKLDDIIDVISKRPNFSESMTSLLAILESAYFKPRMLRDIHMVIGSAGRYTSIFLRVLLSAVESTGRDITANKMAKLLGIIQRICREPGTYSSIKRFMECERSGEVFSTSRYNVVGVLAYTSLTNLLTNPNFSLADINLRLYRKLHAVAYKLAFSFDPPGALSVNVALRNPSVTPRNLGTVLLKRMSSLDTTSPEILRAITGPLATNSYLFNNIARVAGNYERGRDLAESLGARFEDREVCMNFAYALAAIGRKRTVELYRKLGIIYFMRYSRDTLLAVHRNIASKKDKRPILLVAFPHSDHNGAFYYEGQRLSKLTGYRIIITENSTEDSFRSSVESSSRHYGKIDTIIIGGHGSPEAIQLGRKSLGADKSSLDITDSETLASLAHCFAKHPTVVLVSCSTGQGSGSIGLLISLAWGARLFAPLLPSSVSRYIVSKQKRIHSVEFNVFTREFVGYND